MNLKFFEEDKVLYTINEIANLLQVSSRTVRRYCITGELKNAIKIGKQWRIPRQSIVSLITGIK